MSEKLNSHTGRVTVFSTCEGTFWDRISRAVAQLKDLVFGKSSIRKRLFDQFCQIDLLFDLQIGLFYKIFESVFCVILSCTSRC